MYNGRTVVGIVAEFNPFHGGHYRLFQKARACFGQDSILVIAMSGDFVMRGEPAIFNKYYRTEQALERGADLVLEIPAMFATASSEDFAAAGVNVLKKTGLVDVLFFGSETGDLKLLQEISRQLQWGEGIQESLRRGLAQGLSFPKAQELALEESGFRGKLRPNDRLGVCYLKAIRQQGEPFRAACMIRDPALPSAHRLREAMLKEASGEAPTSVGTTSSMGTPISEGSTESVWAPVPVGAEDFAAVLGSRLLYLSSSGVPFQEFQDVSRELGDRLQEQITRKLSFRERVLALKSRNYTYTRISRSLIHILLDIRKEDYRRIRDEEDFGSYLRVLGVKRDLREMLGALAVPLVISPAGWKEQQEKCFATDLLAAHLYGLADGSPWNEFTRKFTVV